MLFRGASGFGPQAGQTLLCHVENLAGEFRIIDDPRHGDRANHGYKGEDRIDSCRR